MAFLLATLLLAATPEVHRTDTLQSLFIFREPPVYREVSEDWTSNGCFCEMCKRLGWAGTKTYQVRTNAPTPLSKLEAVFREIGLSAADVLADAGCGDGRVCVLAAKEFGAEANGWDLRPEAVKLSRANARRNGLSEDQAWFGRGDVRALPTNRTFGRSTVVFVYLTPELTRTVFRQIQRSPQVRCAISYEHPWPSGGRPFGDFSIWIRPKQSAKTSFRPGGS